MAGAEWMLRRFGMVIVVWAALGAGLPAARAQPSPTPAMPASFVQILVRGAEVPGAVIVAMSVVAVAIILEHFRSVRRNALVPEPEVVAAREFIESRRYKECLAALQDSPTMFAQVLLAALRQGRSGHSAMTQAADEAAAHWTGRLQRRAEYLHILGNLGPLMGLLGTVLGMIRAFGKMQETHGAYKPEDLAGGIGLALVNTFLGLVLAVLALGFFGVFRNRIDALTTRATAAVIELLDHFRPAAVAPSPVPVRPPRVEPESVPRSGVLAAPKAVDPVR
jgi:biopolymer transport protein ExbB